MSKVVTPLVVELVYDRDCPHVALARSMIRAALSDVGTEINWTIRDGLVILTTTPQFAAWTITAPTILIKSVH